MPSANCKLVSAELHGGSIGTEAGRVSLPKICFDHRRKLIYCTRQSRPRLSPAVLSPSPPGPACKYQERFSCEILSRARTPRPRRAVRFHAGRAAGGHRHHRRPGGLAPAGGAIGPRSRPPHAVRQPPQAVRAGHCQLRRAPMVCIRSTRRGSGGVRPIVTFQVRILPYMEQKNVFDGIDFNVDPRRLPLNGATTGPILWAISPPTLTALPMPFLRSSSSGTAARRAQCNYGGSLGSQNVDGATAGKCMPFKGFEQPLNGNAAPTTSGWARQPTRRGCPGFLLSDRFACGSPM